MSAFEDEDFEPTRHRHEIRTAKLAAERMLKNLSRYREDCLARGDLHGVQDASWDMQVMTEVARVLGGGAAYEMPVEKLRDAVSHMEHAAEVGAIAGEIRVAEATKRAAAWLRGEVETPWPG